MTGLRIGWATPWNERSIIAASTAEVAFELAGRGHALTVLRTEMGEAAELPPRPAPGPVHPLDAFDDAALRGRFDVVVAQIGDHSGFHGAAIPRFDTVDMVGVFHDAFLANLATGWMQQFGGEPALRHLVRETYGEDALGPAEPFWIGLEEMARRRPMLEWLARRSVAAVAHAGHYAARLRAACPGPVAAIPLAFTAPDLPPPPVPWSRMTVVAIGSAAPENRVDQLIVAIGASAMLRGRCRLRIIGEASPADRKRLIITAAAAGTAPPEFVGRTAKEDMGWHLRDADAISCLRNPTLEGASIPLAVALASGRPTLITAHDEGADLPLDAVMHCRAEHEALDAMRHLERLATDWNWGSEMGARGRALAATRYNTPAAYADALLCVLEEVVARRPLRDARREIFGSLFELGVEPRHAVFWRAAMALEGMEAARGSTRGEAGA